jgi:NADH:flavin oxidoreductases, Old Yellow Enzyme family
VAPSAPASASPQWSDPGRRRFERPGSVRGRRRGSLEYGLAFLELREPGPDGTFGKASTSPVAPAIKAAFKGPLILNSDYDGAAAKAAMAAGRADAIAFGRTYLANPDLPQKLEAEVPFTKDNPATWYSQGPEGYIDYPIGFDLKAAE